MLTRAVPVPMIDGVDVSHFAPHCLPVASCWHISNGTVIDAYCEIPRDAVVVGVSVAEAPYAGSSSGEYVSLSRAVSIVVHYMSEGDSKDTQRVRVAGHFCDTVYAYSGMQSPSYSPSNPIFHTVGAVSFKLNTNPMDGDFSSYSYHIAVYVDDEYVERMMSGESNIHGYRVNREHIGASFESLMADR